MFITVCGASQRKNKEGIPYGWFVTDYDLVERWVDEKIYTERVRFSAKEAGTKIKEHIRKNKPDMNENSIIKFIGVKN